MITSRFRACQIVSAMLVASAALSARAATQNPPAPQQQAQLPPSQGEANHAWQTVSLTGKNWGAALDLPGFVVSSNDVKPDGTAYLLASNRSTWVNVSLTLESGNPAGRPLDCRAEFAAMTKDPAFKGKDSRVWADGGKTYLEFMIHDADMGQADAAHIEQRNLFVCQIHNNVVVSLHLSKVKYVPSDEALFNPIVDSLTFRDITGDSARETAQLSSLDYWKAGSVAFARRDFASAIPSYTEALALEKQNRQLSKTAWYALVDNLGMAYGITGQPEKARAVFQYGIAQDPAYPLFYYHMACYYGQKGDAQNAGTYLKKAYEHKANVVSGETIPDPRTDDSFQQILKDETFRKLVESILSQS
jgi:tetratricopeptide (TPR) repeat protein